MSDNNPRRRRPGPGNVRPAGRKSGPRRPPDVDPPRRAAFDVLRAVSERDAYANLMLPSILRQRRLSGRDAALATELTYGTARATGLLDAVIDACADRGVDSIDGGVLDALRLGVYQLLRTRIATHAAVDSTVQLVRDTAGSPAAGFANAVLRRVSEHDEAQWLAQLAPDPTADQIGHVALHTAHPRWIARSVAEALGDTGEELTAALRANNDRPAVHLVAVPGELTADELAAVTGGDVAPYSPYGVRLAAGSGDPAETDAVRDGLAAVQDEGSQLCARAIAEAELDGSDERWLDLCAGPGGKTRVLGALAALSGATVDAVEPADHRAELVRQAVGSFPVTVHVADGRDPGLPAGYDRVLVDAPCTGLGALRRRPEARWRRRSSDVPELTKLQAQLLESAVDLTRSGGVIGYVVCSPHLAETDAVVDRVAARTGAQPIDTRPLFDGVEDLGSGPSVQLWPHRHGTDGMFCVLLRKP